MILPSEFVIRDSAVRPARNAFDEVRGNAMMDLSNQDASFTTGCVAWQAGIRLLKKDVSGLQLIHIVGISRGYRVSGFKFPASLNNSDRPS